MSILDIETLRTLCRVCLNPGHKSSKENPFGTAAQNSNISSAALRKLFRNFSTIDVMKEDENYPKHLCLKCLTKLKDFRDFRAEALRSSQRLEIFFKDRNKGEEETDNICHKEVSVGGPDFNGETIKTEDKSCECSNNNNLDEDAENDDNTLLFPEMAEMFVDIKTEPIFEICNTTITNAFYRNSEEIVLSNSKENFGAGTNNEVSLETHTSRLECSNVGDQILSQNYRYEKPFQCEHCSIAFEVYADLTLHVLTSHTDEIIRKPETQNQSTASNAIYNCQICGNNYASQRALICHVKNHNGIKENSCEEFGVNKVTKHQLLEKYQCPLCPQEFNLKSAISRHIKVEHEGVNRYPCSFCPRRFADRNLQISHERLHTGERLFKCSMCPSTFTQKKNLVSHIRNHDIQLSK